MAYCFLTNMLMLLLVALWAQGGSPQATTFYPTAKPTLNIFPTPRPTAFPTLTGPSPQPTAVPTNVPTAKPSARPSLKPPTASPTITPTAAPTASPTLAPTLRPTLAKPTGQPSGQPSRQPTRRPTGQPTRQPSRQPTGQPSRKPSGQPSKMPSRQPTAQPSRLPSGQPTRRPSQQPSRQPSGQPTAQPSRRPTGQPSRQPTAQPSRQPSSQPSGQPSRQPTAKPSMQPSRQPTSQPSVQPTAQPSRQPSRQPTGQPSRQPTAPPSRQPSSQPTGQPTRQPSRQPSGQPSRQPTGQPSRQPTGQPTREPTSPTGQPSRQPSRQPTGQPTSGPTRRPTPVVDYIHTRRFQALDASTFSVYTSLWLSTHANWQLFYASSAGSSAPDPPRAGASGCPARSQLQYPVCLGGVPVDGKDGLVLNASYAFESLSGVADSVSCPKILCYGGSDASSVPYRLDCLPTPSDTVEYLPPKPPFSDQNDSTLCLPLDAASVGGAPSVNPWVAPPHYGFNQGVPPLYEPVPVVRLVLKGHIKASVDANTCSVVQGAVVEAWQIDASASAAFDASTAHTIAAATGTPQAGAAFPTVSGASLRGLSCRSQAKSDEQGSYQFNTTVPPSYGPPRHIVVRVSAPGFKPLLTRVYFTNDFRLQQLTTWGSDYTRFDAQNEGPNKFASRPGLKLTSVGNPNGSVWLDSFKETTDAAGADTILADSAIGRDPRVRTAEWVSLATGTGYGFGGNGFPLGLEQGYFVVNFDVTLRPDRASDNPAVSADGSVSTSSALSEMPVAQLDGLWVAADGGLVRVQTQGNLFYASEYPGPRSWGSVLGNVFGNTIRGIDFSQSASSSSSSPAYSSTPFLNVFSRDSVGESVGAVLQQDSFVTAPLQPASASALSIAWSGGATPRAWSKQSDVEAAGYRFFKLEISRQFSPLPSSSDGAGTVVINEVVLYDGIFSQREVPSRDLKMKSARTPAPLKVSCSSFRSQDQHCFKAFDGLVGSSSAWVSDGLPTSDGVQHQRFGVNRAPLWIVLDLGPGRGALPTALQIVCNAAVAVSSNPSAGGCPRTFNLLGSMDNGHFDLLFHADLSQAQNVSVYGNSSADVPGSATFFMPWESSAGRPNGHQCGSCDQGPNFVCSTDSHDSSCFSRYCSAAGVCSDVPSCALGEYMRQQSSGAGGPDFFCTPCPPGRHGDSSGLTSPSCSGLCLPGYFCPAGSTSPKQRECGSAAFYCPVGSAAPVAAGAGRFTVSVSTIGAEGASSPVGLSVDAGGNQVLARTRTTDVVCPLGHYCRGGMSIPCPVGTYGDRPGLQTPACADSCIAGEYCPSGSVTPTRCPKGYFCPDGLTRAVCPAGTFGAAAGLSSVRCSGLCKQGHFCPEGSTSATQQQCPGGRYGLTAGLPDSSCSGPCPAGYFCPPASTSASAFGCSKHLSPPLTCNKVPVKDAAGTRMVEVCSRGINEPTVAGPKRNSVVNFAALNSNSSAGDVLNQPILAPQANPLYYCPEGSAFPIEATHGYFTVGGDEGHRQAQAVCDLGYYCVDGVRRSCPAGSFGATSGLTGSVFVRPTATPTQPPGVPSRSPTVVPTRVPTSRPVGAPTGQPSGRPTRNPTGQPTRQPSRQPTGQPSRQPTRQPSARPTRLAMRRSKYPTGQPTRQPSRQPTGQPTRHPARPSLLPTGQPTRSPTRQPSSRPSGQPTSQPSLRPTGRPTVNINGTVDYQSLLSPVFCSGFCARGFFCPANSTSSRQSPCPPGKYGFTTGLASSDCTANCPLGHYCPAGTADPIPCPAGTFGNTTGLIDSTCNGECTEGGCSPALCQEGFYCPSGSVSATEVACGGPGVYCPTGSAAPTVVSVGYHSIGPFPYENSQTRTAQALCPPGSFCEGGVMRPCPVGRYGGTAGLSNASCSGLCREGTYCPLGSWNESTLLCPAGRYGQVKGMWSSACSGECSRGYHCPEGSTSSKELECGVATPAARTDLFFSKTAFEVSGYLGDYGPSTEAPITTGGSAFLAKNASRLILDLPNAVFCPTGSAAPLKVLPGYYSVGGTRTTRWAQQVCPMGSYCVDGVVYDCPAGRYGGGDRLTTSDCTGPCAKGYYCPSASTTKNQEPCPVGRYGNSEGLTDSGCSGACKRPTDCPLASVFATPPATLIDSNVY